VLLILGQGRSYGYEIRAQLEAFGFRRAVEDPGVVYRILKRLEDSGLIRSEWDTSTSGPARHYYHLTDAGRDRLEVTAEQLARQARRIELFFEKYRALPAPVSMGA
jgi:DNA-binding PadR family transcriptional regulator